jgi:hypothetical protein
MSTSKRERTLEFEHSEVCAYCNKKSEKLTEEHILPLSKGGPDEEHNLIWVCRSCNSKKRDQGLYEFFTHRQRNELPRIAEGKYLKLLYNMHREKDTLELWDLSQVCPICTLRDKCKEKGMVGEFNVYCLEGFITSEKINEIEVKKRKQQLSLDDLI